MIQNKKINKNNQENEDKQNTQFSFHNLLNIKNEP